jgi:hypothetical protein
MCKPGDRQHMRQAGIAQGGFVIGIDAAAFARDDGAGNGAFAVGKLRANARRHRRAHAFDQAGNAL